MLMQGEIYLGRGKKTTSRSKAGSESGRIETRCSIEVMKICQGTERLKSKNRSRDGAVGLNELLGEERRLIEW